MTLYDPANNIRVEQLFALTNTPGSTGGGTDYAPSYSAPNFTRAFDARPYQAAIIIVPVETVGANVTLNLKLQQSAEPFTTWTDITGGAFTARTSANDDTVLCAKIDLGKYQNAVGLHINVTLASGTNRARLGAYALLMPYDTANSGFTADFTETLNLM